MHRRQRRRGRSIRHLAQRLRAARLEVRVLIKHGTVGADVAGRVAGVLRDGGDAAGRQARGARADQLGGAPDELELGLGGVDAELVLEEVFGLVKVLEGVTGKG